LLAFRYSSATDSLSPVPAVATVERAHGAGSLQRLVVLDELQGHHQPDHLAQRGVLAGSLAGEFGKLADQILEDGAYRGVVDQVGVQVERGEVLQMSKPVCSSGRARRVHP
jgi:hypothetical protein